MEWYEQELEDYIVEKPKEMFSGYSPPMDEITVYSDIHFLGRQIPCACGIIDLMFGVTNRTFHRERFDIFVIELKAVTADKKTVEQVNRYQSAVEKLDLYALAPNDNEFLDYLHLLYHNIRILPLIVAPKFSQSIEWFDNGIIVNKTAKNFEFRAKPHTKNDPNYSPLAEAMRPIVHMAYEAGKRNEMCDKLNKGIRRAETSNRFLEEKN